MSLRMTYPHYATPITTHSSQFDSPVFNNGSYQQPLFNSVPYHVPVLNASRLNFPPTPQFQTIHSHPYSPHSYPLPSIRPTTKNHTHGYCTNIRLDSSSFVVPSQHRNTLDTQPVGDAAQAGSDMLYSTSHGNFPPKSIQDFE
jgi:hypothetical protein